MRGEKVKNDKLPDNVKIGRETFGVVNPQGGMI